MHTEQCPHIIRTKQHQLELCEPGTARTAALLYSLRHAVLKWVVRYPEVFGRSCVAAKSNGLEKDAGGESGGVVGLSGVLLSVQER